MFKIDVQNYGHFNTLGTEFVGNSLIVYGFGFEAITFVFSAEGKKLGEYTYKTENHGKSFFKISLTSDEALIVEEPVDTKTVNRTAVIFKPYLRTNGKNEEVVIYY